MKTDDLTQLKIAVPGTNWALQSIPTPAVEALGQAPPFSALSSFRYRAGIIAAFYIFYRATFPSRLAIKTWIGFCKAFKDVLIISRPKGSYPVTLAWYGLRSLHLWFVLTVKLNYRVPSAITTANDDFELEGFLEDTWS